MVLSKSSHKAIKVVNNRKVMDVEKLVARDLVRFAGKLERGLSKKLREDYGIGIVEWRLMCGLAVEPEIPASQLSRYTLTDKGSASRALKSLEEKGLIVQESLPENIHIKLISLTEKGFVLYDEFYPIVLEREDKIFEGRSENEIKLFFEMLNSMSTRHDHFLLAKFGYSWEN